MFLYCISYSKDSIAMYTFNFGTKAFIIWLAIDDATVVKMWIHERFVDS